MVVRKFSKLNSELKETAQELGLPCPCEVGKFSASIKIKGAKWKLEGFVHDVITGLCRLTLTVAE